MTELVNRKDALARIAANQRPWYVMENTVSVPLAVAQEIVWARLSECFRGVVTSRGGFLAAGLEFDCVIDGNDIEVRYTSRGRSTLKYTITGELSRTATGTKLDLSLRENVLRSAVINAAVAFAVVLIGTFAAGQRVPGWALVALPAGIAIAVVVGVLNFLVGIWYRQVALSSTTHFLTRIANGQFYE